MKKQLKSHPSKAGEIGGVSTDHAAGPSEAGVQGNASRVARNPELGFALSEDEFYALRRAQRLVELVETLTGDAGRAETTQEQQLAFVETTSETLRKVLNACHQRRQAEAALNEGHGFTMHDVGTMINLLSGLCNGRPTDWQRLTQKLSRIAAIDESADFANHAWQQVMAANRTDELSRDGNPALRLKHIDHRAWARG